MSTLSARALVFFTSAAVLVMEVLAGRLMAPFVGVTLETFTGIIGTVLAGIALGAWLGGRAADQRPPQTLIGPALVAGGILALLSPTIVAVMGPSFSGGTPVEIVVLTAVGFFLPAVVLSTVPPLVVKVKLQDLGETGAVVGQYSAFGTFGAIFGTFVTGFVLVAALPTRPILLGVGGALVITGLVMATRHRLVGSRAVALLAVAAVGVGALTAAFPGPCQTETAYFCARVTADEERPTGRVLWLDNLRHSYVDLEDPTHVEFRYGTLFVDAITTQAPQGALDALYIGGGGFTFPRWLKAVRPGSTNTVLELDGSLVDISRDQLGLEDTDTDEIQVGDARMTIAATPQGHFELVVGDAFGGPSVPWHLTTKEFLETVRNRMAPGGIYVMNLIDYPPAAFARAETATLLAVFDHVAAVAPFDYFEGPRGGNFVLVASNTPLDIDALDAALRAHDAEEQSRSGAELTEWVGDARVLVDDFAPVDQLISH